MRVLIVDDEPGVHDCYRRSFVAEGVAGAAAKVRPAKLFGNDAAKVDFPPSFELTHCHQGLDAVAAVEAALASGDPYPVAFVATRLSPGTDGMETARRIRALDGEINIVVVNDSADVSPLGISREAGPVDKIFCLAKPFAVAEVVQFAAALGRRWQVDREAADARETLRRRVAWLEEQGLELAANESRAVHVATHDPLTDAPNRLAFKRALADRARRAGGFAIAMIDLDRFKLVNDTLGHLAGDELLRQLCGALQSARPEGGLLARLGGDEFALLFDTPGEDAATTACGRLVDSCSGSRRVFGNSVRAGASVGLMVCGDASPCDVSDLMRGADLALNAAKRAGRGVVRLYDAGMDQSVRFRRRVETGLAGAIKRDELALAYQPIVARDALDIVGFEALLRWNTDEYGPMSPGTFIPIAEESNLIHALGDWVLARALDEVARWPGQYVSVNFSPRQFRRHNFVGHIAEAVRRAGVEPARLQIEITERAIFDDAERAADTLYRLRQLGFRIALDDFGTGYSSLYKIRKFALDSLKIDRSFIDGIARERESAAIVHSIVHLGRSLGLGVTAEGVETEAQVALLRVAGATHLQGYHFSRPVPAVEARAMASRGTCPTDRAGDAGTGTRG